MANETNLTIGAIEPDYTGVASVINTNYRTPGALDPLQLTPSGGGTGAGSASVGIRRRRRKRMHKAR